MATTPEIKVIIHSIPTPIIERELLMRSIDMGAIAIHRANETLRALKSKQGRRVAELVKLDKKINS